MKPELKSTRDKSGTLNVTLSGDLIVKYANDLRVLFRELLSEKDVALKVEHPSAIDLSFLQLLWAFQKQTILQGQSVTVSFALNEADHLLLSRTGFKILLK